MLTNANTNEALGLAAMKQCSEALAVHDNAAALRWAERAHRQVPTDPNAGLLLATACLATDPARAASLFQSIASTHDIRQAWLGLAAAHQRLDAREQAADAVAAALSRFAFSPNVIYWAEETGGRAGSPGWCALRSDGGLEIHGTMRDRVRVSVDGKPLRGATLPPGWERNRTIDVRLGNRPLLGSPIQIAAIRRVSGCVEVFDGGIRGWAWYPGDPDAPPVLTLTCPARGLERSVVASELATVPDTGPLAVPRSFQVTRSELPGGSGAIHVRGPDGKDLLGSPLDPFQDEAAHVAAAGQIGTDHPAGAGAPLSVTARAGNSAVLRANGPVPAQPVGADGRKRPATVVIPVHNGGRVVLDCLASVLASLPPAAKVLVVDDGSSDPAIVAALDDMVRRRKIGMIRHPVAMGFPAAANAGIRGSADRDVVLLNSDTLVPPGWLDRLRHAAYASRDTGTVTPLSNDASILSYAGEHLPDQAETNRLDSLAQRANGTAVVDIPVGVGFCLYLRRDCLNAVGSFRSGLFAQGYGEENDLCLRARRLGWRNVALTGLFVGHLGGASFGDNARHLRTRNGRIVEQLHPGHDALIAHFMADDPLAGPRRRIDQQAFAERARTWPQSAILISHAAAGGVEQRLMLSAQTHELCGRHPLLLRPAKMANGEPAITIRDGVDDDLANLIFAMPTDLPALLRLLGSTKPAIIEAHHVADFPPAIYDLIAGLGISYDVHVHDFALFCPRIALVGAHNRYCGEPALHDCEACIADNGSFLSEDIPVAALRTRSAAFLAGARRVVVPSDDTGLRMRLHFAGLKTVTVPHGDDGAITRASPPRTAGRGRPRVCVVGSIGVHKGYDILLACARDAARRELDLEFVVVGHTIDDARLMATGRVFVTGQFKPDEVISLIKKQDARIGFVASVCPETWCLSLTDLWLAGLSAAVFDIGAPAERVRRKGQGILLPLDWSAADINNRFVAATHPEAH